MPSSACQKCALDRKSTRLNSSHTIISYAVFCLKKNNKNGWPPTRAMPMPTTKQHTTPRAGACPLPVGEDARLASMSAERPVCLLFFNDTATTEIYTLSLHDALPINDTATTEIYPLSLHDASDLGGRRIILLQNDLLPAGKDRTNTPPQSSHSPL